MYVSYVLSQRVNLRGKGMFINIQAAWMFCISEVRLIPNLAYSRSFWSLKAAYLEKPPTSFSFIFSAIVYVIVYSQIRGWPGGQMWDCTVMGTVNWGKHSWGINNTTGNISFITGWFCLALYLNAKRQRGVAQYMHCLGNVPNVNKDWYWRNLIMIQELSGGVEKGEASLKCGQTWQRV